MLEQRMEELQISWACSAQNPALLPQKMKSGSGKESFKQRAERDFENGKSTNHSR